MADHRKSVCAWCSKTLSEGGALIVDGHRFHSEACARAWDRLWSRLAVAVWIIGIVYILVIVLRNV
jgi:hypothetical protein